MTNMRLNNEQIQWIVDNFNFGREIEELSLDTGLSQASIKRALSEAGVIDLSWHKSQAQHELLTYLRTKGITSVKHLQGATL